MNGNGYQKAEQVVIPTLGTPPFSEWLASSFRPAHAALLILLATPARAGIVPPYLLVRAEKRCRLSFEIFVMLLC